MRTYKQLTQELRYLIYQLNKIEWTQSAIAKEIGGNKSTVCRELKRNAGQRGYRPKQPRNCESMLIHGTPGSINLNKSYKILYNIQSLV